MCTKEIYLDAYANKKDRSKRDKSNNWITLMEKQKNRLHEGLMKINVCVESRVLCIAVFILKTFSWFVEHIFYVLLSDLFLSLIQTMQKLFKNI